MGINEIGNIIYLKDFIQHDPDGKKAVEKRTQGSDRTNAGNRSKVEERAAAVEEQNRLASSPSIGDFEEAVKVMGKLEKMMLEGGDSLLAVHSAKPVDPSSI